jgi:para-nitrobenzyl esterase
MGRERPGGGSVESVEIVETQAGRLAGLREGGVSVFRGIPYAAPPVGARRLRPPQPVAPWRGVRPAREFGLGAPQAPSMMGALLGISFGGSAEDCLSLNVWTPACDGAKRPVLVWLHGGGFVFGASNQPIYSGDRLARRGDAVVVTLNYRLGVLGWLALPALEREEGGVAGNLGLLDQIAALRWVRANVERFGGDPDDVTLFGESAGAMSVGTLLGTPAARGLFRRAILQSGAAHNASEREDGARMAHAVMKELGLADDDVSGLRAAPVDAVLAAQQKVLGELYDPQRGLPFQPVVDGRVLPRRPLDAIRDGLAAGVSILVGTNLEEWRIFGLGDAKLKTLDEAGLVQRVERTVPGADDTGLRHAHRAVETYRRAREARAPAAPADLWLAIEGDRVFRVPAVRLADAARPHAPSVHKYLFTWRSPALGGALGACHALEIPFVFGTIDVAPMPTFAGAGPAAERLSARLQDAWLSFARDGRPASPDLVPWPAYDETRRATMLLGEACDVVEAPYDEERAFWDGLL